jgi:hypothetical protein
VLVDRVEKKQRLSVRALGCFLARAGARAALEDPELAETVALQGSGDPDVVALELTNPRDYRPPLSHDPKTPFMGPEVSGDHKLLAAQLRRYPRDPTRLALVVDGKGRFGPFSQVVHLFRALLGIQSLHRLYELASELGGDAQVAGAPGAAADAILEDLPREAADDVLGHAVTEGDPGNADDAIHGVAAIMRVNELDAHVESRDQGGAWRDRLVFRAFRDLGRLEHAGGCLALPFRARLRRLAFAGRLGDWLARVDLRRIIWLSTHAIELGVDPETSYRNGHEAPAFELACFVAAVEAWSPARPSEVPDPGLAADAAVLVDLGLQWVREQEVRLVAGAPPSENLSLEKRIDERAKGFTKWSFYTRAVGRSEKLRGKVPPLLTTEAFMAQMKLADAQLRSSSRDNYRFVPPRAP